MLKRSVRNCGDCELLVQGKCVFSPKTLAASAIITSQDTVAEEVTFVRSGLVATTVLTPNGDHEQVAVRGPRSMLGLEALRGVASKAEVATVTSVEVCAAPVRTVQAWLGPDTGARRMFELSLSELLDQRRDVDFQSGSAEARVARFLLLCADHLGRGRHGPISKTRAASMLSLRAETFSRVLTRFAARRLIETGRRVRVLDAPGLSRVAEG